MSELYGSYGRAGPDMNSSVRLIFVMLSALVLLCGCSQRGSQMQKKQVNIGFFPNITHSQALIGLYRGDFQNAFGPEVRIDAKAFNAGPSVVEALFAGQIDLAYVGPNPAINGYVISKGGALRVVAGVASGGASLVIRNGVEMKSTADLAGKTIATPQLGNTQDIALRGFLASVGLLPTERGGNVTVIPMENPTILDAFRQGRIDGAWVPEPWASRLEMEGNGRVFIDERTLWPRGEFTTALVVTSTQFLSKHPDLVRKWLVVHVRITKWELSFPKEAAKLANAEIKALTGKDLPMKTLERAWGRMTPTCDPLISTLQRSADNAFAAGFLKSRPDLGGLVDVNLLNDVLAEEDLPRLQ